MKKQLSILLISLLLLTLTAGCRDGDGDSAMSDKPSNEDNEYQDLDSPYSNGQ